MLRKQSIANFESARKKGAVVSGIKAFDNFDLYRYYPDKYADDKASEERKLQQHRQNVSNAGRPINK